MVDAHAGCAILQSCADQQFVIEEDERPVWLTHAIGRLTMALSRT